MGDIHTGFLMVIVGLLALEYFEANRKLSKPTNMTPPKPVGELTVTIKADTSNINRELDILTPRLQEMEERINSIQSRASIITGEQVE